MQLNKDQELITGINTVMSILKERPKSIDILYIKDKNLNQRLEQLLNFAEKKRINIEKKDSLFFKKQFSEEKHQGVAIKCNKRTEENENFLHDLVEKKKNLFLLLLDGITDPHNVGACLRSAAAAHVDAVIVPKNRSCHLTPTVRKVSLGGAELIPFVVVINLTRTIEWLQLKGVKIIGTSVSATNPYSNANLQGSIGFVIGSEHKGLRRLVEKNCDELVSIPMSEKMESLNASVTTGIVLFEYLKQNNFPNL